MYHFQINGLNITCDTVAELQAAAESQIAKCNQTEPQRAAHPDEIYGEQEANGHVDGRTLYHQRVARYAKRNNLTHMEARRKLAKK